MTNSTTTPPGRPGRMAPANWVARLLVLLLLPALLFAGCATQTTPSSPSAPASPSDSTAAAPPADAASAIIALAAAAPASAASAADSDVAPVPVPIDPLRPEVRLDLDDRAARLDLWDRVRRGFALPDLDTELVRRAEQWYATRPDYVQRMTERGGRYLF